VDAALLMLAQKIVNEGQGTKVFLIMQTTPGFELPPELAEHCEYIEHDLPESEERLSIITDLGVELESADKKVLEATAGLSRAKTAQYVAETLASFGYLNPMAVFKKKALHLGRSSKLAVWSPDFVERVKLWPSPKVEELAGATDVNVIHEETHINNRELGEDEVRARLQYIEGDKMVERWLDPMPKAEFEKLYRPDRDFYSFKSVIGLDGLKEFLSNGFRENVPLRARLKHILMLGVPGTGKSHMMRCTSGEFSEPICEMQVDQLYSKWLGDTDKILARMLRTAGMIGGILAIDEFQRFLPKSGGDTEGSGVENRMGGSILTWLNDQNSNLVMSAANNISNLPDEFTRSGRCDVTMFVGFPGQAAKEAAWKMYIRIHELEDQELPQDEYWTPADIMNCCRLAEQQRETLKRSARFVTPSYEKNRKQMDTLMEWAEGAGCVCAETGERFVHPRKVKAVSSTPKKVTRKVRGKKETDG
jgi:AAA+ superfamily predicted ATPase